VFQLPRGNLEGIYPKIIMINQVQKKIAKREYRCAFEIIRTHKLDFNLLYDLNPEQFFTEIEAVLKDIKRVDFINLLVSQISDAISSELQYALSTKKLEEFAKDFEINMKGKKVKSVCRAVSETLRRLDKK
jgi:elongator complex protein 1